MKLQGLAWVLLGAAIGFFGCSSDKGGGGGGGGGGGDETAETEEDDGQTDGAALDPIDWTKVEFNFVSPKDTEDLAPGNVTIEIDTNLGTQGTWSLYYTTSFQSIDNATPIKEDMAPSDTTVVWDTTQVEPSTYFLFASLHFGSQVNVRFFQGAITVEEEGADNRTPFLTIGTTLNEATLQQGTDLALTWTMIEPDGEDVTQRIELSSDEGETWEDLGLTITPDADDATQFSATWTIPAGQTISSKYRIRVAAKDTANKEGVAITGKVGITDVGGVTFRNKIMTVLGGTCAVSGCHDSAISGNLNLEFYDNPLTGGMGARSRDNTIWTRINLAVSDAMFMPQVGSLTQEEKDLIEMWLWNNSNAGSGRPDIRNRNYDNRLFVVDQAFNIRWQVNDLVSDGTEDLASVVLEYKDVDDADWVNLDISGATRTPNGGELDYEFAWTPTEAGHTLGAGQMRVSTDNSFGRVRRESAAIRLVKPIDPMLGATVDHATALTTCTTGSLPSLSDLRNLFNRLTDFNTLGVVWTSTDDANDANNARTFDLSVTTSADDAEGTLVKTDSATALVICIDGI